MAYKIERQNSYSVQYCSVVYSGFETCSDDSSSLYSRTSFGRQCAVDLVQRTQMKRRQLFEFGDQEWMRGWLREAYLDGLNLTLRIAGQYAKMHRPFSAWASAAGSPPVLDLGSGGAGPIKTIVLAAQAENVALPLIVLSDLYPSSTHYENLARRLDGRVSHITEPVSATAVHRTEFRMRSLCSVFHHFPPAAAKQIVEDAARWSDGIFIMEPFERNVLHFVMTLLGGPFVYMLTPFLSPRFSLRKLLACLVLPIVPLMLFFDGCVSVLRVYTGKEIEEMFPPDVRQDFDFRSGRLTYMGLFQATFFCASRKKT